MCVQRDGMCVQRDGMSVLSGVGWLGGTWSGDVLKAVKWPKYTATGLALREWLETIEENTQPEPEIEPAKMNTEGFGPDA